MANQILSEEFRRMQKLAGIITEEQYMNKLAEGKLFEEDTESINITPQQKRDFINQIKDFIKDEDFDTAMSNAGSILARILTNDEAEFIEDVEDFGYDAYEVEEYAQDLVGYLNPLNGEDLLEKANGGTPEQEKIKKVVDQYVNLRKAIDDPNYPDTPHTYSAMKKVENILNQMSRKENYRIFLLKILPTQYQDFLK